MYIILWHKSSTKQYSEQQKQADKQTDYTGQHKFDAYRNK